MLVLLLLAQVRAACPEPQDTQHLLNAMASAEASFASMNSVAFDDSVAEMRRVLPCVNAPLSALDVAEVHQIEAYDAFLRRSNDEVLRHFAAMQHSAPAAVLPSSVAPEGHPLRALWTGATLMLPPETELLPPPRDAALRIDGVGTRERPTALPSVVQLIDEDGSVRWTLLVDPGQALPIYERELLPDPEKPRGKPVGALLGAAGSVMVAGALWGFAEASERSFQDENTPYQDLGALRKQTNGLLLGSAAAGATALGLGVYAVVRW